MRLFWVQYLKDFKANFYNFNAYILVAIYYVLSLFSTIYLGDYFLREIDVMNAFFVMQPVILIFVIPAITMRTWAEEIKTGTIEILLTQPIGYFSLVMAKFLASYSFFGLLLSSSFLLSLFSNSFSIADIGVIISGYIGVLLIGALFCAVGCCVSIFNKNNILSYVTTIFVLFTITQIKFTNWNEVSLLCLNFEDNFSAFLGGVLAFGNISYFVILSCVFVWINLIGIYVRKNGIFKEKYSLSILLVILSALFISLQLGGNLIFDRQFDITKEQKFTLLDENKDVLKNIDNRIDITLYVAKNAREEANSSFAVFTEYFEKILKQFEKSSNGSVRVNIVLVEPFGELERRLIKDGVKFEEDKLGYKKFIALEFTSNEGNYKLIKSFSSLRQNLLESDLLRIIMSFDKDKKKIAVFASNNDLDKMSYFLGMINEFYDVSIINEIPSFIPPNYDAVIFVRTDNISSHNFLAMEQYVLNGGNLVIFGEHSNLVLPTGKHIASFLDNYGINPLLSNSSLLKDKLSIAPCEPMFKNIKNDVRSVLVNGSFEVECKKQKGFEVHPLIKFNDKNIGAVSFGRFISNHLDLSFENTEILPSSIKDGKIAFIYDTDLLMDYIYTSDETKSNYYYDIVLTADNQLFLLRLIDYMTENNIETNIRYRHFLLNNSSIGNEILSQVKERYKDKIEQLENKIEEYMDKRDVFYDVLSAKGFASVKNIGELSEFEQTIDETTSELNKTKLLIANEYQTIIISFTLILIFGGLILCIGLLFGILSIAKKIKQKKFKEAINDI